MISLRGILTDQLIKDSQNSLKLWFETFIHFINFKINRKKRMRIIKPLLNKKFQLKTIILLYLTTCSQKKYIFEDHFFVVLFSYHPSFPKVKVSIDLKIDSDYNSACQYSKSPRDSFFLSNCTRYTRNKKRGGTKGGRKLRRHVKWL